MNNTINDSRRLFLHGFARYLAATSATCLSCQNAFGFFQSDSGTPKDWPVGIPDEGIIGRGRNDNYSSGRYRMRGCTLLANSNQGGNSGHRFLHSSGDPNFDRVIFEEARILAYVTGMYPSFAFVDDRDAPNAFANSQDIIAGRSPHGAIGLGLTMVNNMFRDGGDITVVGAIMVHEWTHIAQFQVGVRSRGATVAPTELMSDFMAGWFHGFRCSYGCQQADPRFAESGLHSIGDYNTQEQGHHGTPEQRATAYRDGYVFVSQGGGGGIYGFQQYQSQFSAFNNPYGSGGYGGVGGQGSQSQNFQTAFQYAARKYVG